MPAPLLGPGDSAVNKPKAHALIKLYLAVETESESSEQDVDKCCAHTAVLSSLCFGTPSPVFPLAITIFVVMSLY